MSKRDTTAPTPSPAMIEKILTKLADGYKSGKGCGAADAETCRTLIVNCNKWTNFDWMNMGMQLGVLE